MAIRQRIFVRGMVQGIGFRPYVYRHALAHGLSGFVGNNSEGAFVEIEGSPEQAALFVDSLRTCPPPHARIDGLELTEISLRGEAGFRIVESESNPECSTPVSPDLAICDECLIELFDPSNRRFRYPFLNCIHCGPRFTIIEDIPYDRPNTTMRGFVMCAECEAEYTNPSNRRFHAQPNACWKCGPTVWLRGHETVAAGTRRAFPQGIEAIDRARALMAEGQIVAIKGIGGYHLACDATNEAAVSRLRQRKGRVEKPFALMVRDLASVRRIAVVNEVEAQLLSGRERPIVLLARRTQPEIELAVSIAPGNGFLGVMLPYAPLHCLLVGETPLVMTSANRSDEPIVRSNEEALDRLAMLADAFLMHDRPIHVVCDDSVVRIQRGLELPIRRSRGYTPLPLPLAAPGRSVFAVGGELKASFCITRDKYAYMSQHIGDLGSPETQEAFARAADHFLTLFRAVPEAIACDLHPGYLSNAWAAHFAESRALPLVKVQHHEAHVASLMTEHGIVEDSPFLGIVFDGTGYGHDGAIWGGEFLLWQDGAFRRVAHLRYVPLPGGDAAIRHPWRVAMGHLLSAGINPEPWVTGARRIPWNVLQQQLARGLNCIPTSSMGRLFDAVAAVLHIREDVSYEAQAAVEMETLCRGVEPEIVYSFDVSTGSPAIIDPTPMWHQLVADMRNGVNQSQLSARFHASIVAMVRDVAVRLRQDTGVHAVGLSGGSFQNLTLLGGSQSLLESAGFRVCTHSLVPPNDGGIALGQAWLARR